jgi:hypothetical protein
MPDEITGMGKTHGNASLICKKVNSETFFSVPLCTFEMLLYENDLFIKC